MTTDTSTLAPDLEQRLIACDELPTLPSVAAKIIDLLRSDDYGLDDIAAVVELDPAINTKLVRLANSATYRRGPPIGDVRQAVMRLGQQATVMTALSFSLGSKDSAGGKSNLDYETYWRRSLLAAAAGRAVAYHVNYSNPEEVFLASMVQDIGQIVLDRVDPSLYADLPAGDSQHARAIEREVERLSVDHSAVGAWLLEQWHFPSNITDAVAISHDFAESQASSEPVSTATCVLYSGALADALCAGSEVWLVRASSLVANLLETSDADPRRLLDELMEQVDELSELFDTTLVPDSETLQNESKQLLFDRMMQSPAAPGSECIEQMEERLTTLEAKSQTDPLTGLYNRAEFDARFAAALEQAQAADKRLSLMFIDVDHFKSINDQYGHMAGDEVLKWAADALKSAVRDTDIVARYGGEEFVIVLPELSEEQAQKLGERVLSRFRDESVKVGDDQINVTVSIGVACCDTHDSAQKLLIAADQAMYFVKQTGRDNCVGATRTKAA